MISPTAPRTRNGFKIAIICAVSVEAESVRAVFDKCWNDEGREYGKAAGDKNTYTTGVIGRYNVVLVLLSSIGSVPAAQAVASLSSSYSRIELVLVVGVCGVVPLNPSTGEEIVLGDVIVSTAVTQYDFGRTYPGGFQRKTSNQDSLGKAPKEVQGFVNNLGIRQNCQKLRAELKQLVGSIQFLQNEPMAVYPGAVHDHLYDATYLHQHRPPASCDMCNDGLDGVCPMLCDKLGCEKEKRIVRQRLQYRQTPDHDSCLDDGPFIHFGRIGCANTVMKSGAERDKLMVKEQLIAFEMEGVGVWDERPTIVIKGACDYADSHKNKIWQPYAAMMAAGCLKVVLAKWVMADESKSSDLPKSVGLCFTSAPLIQTHEFIGRKTEINTIHDALHPHDTAVEQRRVVLGGIGGIGKTQLAIAYARQYAQNYTSVLWLDATSELTVFNSLRLIAGVLSVAYQPDLLDNRQVLAHFQAWLNHPHNHQWLLILDNYDEPDQLDLNDFCPHVGHGSIIITTRLPDKVTGIQLRMKPLATAVDGLDILQIRSGRTDVKNDPGAHRVVERMAGLPLALVTAGAFLRKTPLTFQQYVEIYEKRWQMDYRRPLQLQEYQNRTLYTTWDLSYSRLTTEDIEAAEMLKLLAYFDHQDVWYGLLQAGLSNRMTSSLLASLSDEVYFVNVMSTLVDYGFVEVQHANQSYRMHNCVHDWTLGSLNRDIDTQLHWYAFDCVAASIDKKDWDLLSGIQYARISHHAKRLTHDRFKLDEQLVSGFSVRLFESVWIAQVLKDQMQFSAAEQMYLRVLAGYEKTLGVDHISTLGTVNNLGILYSDQGKLVEAEQLYKRALAGYEKALGADHPLTLDAVRNLGLLYADQDKPVEAEAMHKRALAGYEKALGADHTSTLNTVNNLGLLYAGQGKLAEAEQLYKRALSGYEKALGTDHTWTLNAVYNLGLLYAGQGKLAEAEQLYKRALSGYEKALGTDHTSTLDTVYNLGLLYADQDKPVEAEAMHKRALAGYEKALGADHTSTLGTVNNLGILYADQGKLVEAEQMYEQALAGKEKALGADHTSTLNTVNNLGILYADQGKLVEAEAMYKRALAGYEKALGADHTSTLDTVNNLGILYTDQGKLVEAEQMYEQARAGFERTLGRDHPSTQRIIGNIDELHNSQDNLAIHT